MNPFLYPKAKHRRRLKPPAYTSYQSFKKVLRVEFNGQCVYCCMPDGPKTPAAFGVDHYKPKGKPEFARLSTLYENLFYACNACNSRKGKHWPTDEQWDRGEFIPNPCDHIMFEHLRYHVAKVELRSVAGKHADKILMLNDNETVKYREFIIDAIYLAECRKREIEQTIADIEALIASQPSESLNNEKREAERDLTRAENILRHLGA